MLQRQMQEKEKRQRVEREREKVYPPLSPNSRPSYQESFQNTRTLKYNEGEENGLHPFLVRFPSFGETTHEKRGNTTMTKVRKSCGTK